MKPNKKQKCMKRILKHHKGKKMNLIFLRRLRSDFLDEFTVRDFTILVLVISID